MPSISPRVNVVVTPEQHALLMKLGRLQGRSAASYLREMLDASQPMLAALVPVLEAAVEKAARQPEELRRAIRDVLLEVDAGRAQLTLLDHLAGVQHDVSNDRGTAGSDAARSGATEDVAAPARKRSRKR